MIRLVKLCTWQGTLLLMLQLWYFGGVEAGGGVGLEIWGAETLLWGRGKGGHVPCVSLTQL